MNDKQIPPRFVRAVALHIVRNILRLPGFHPPLILGIHGPSGEGKTFQCEAVLQEMGVKILLISGGQLESPDAGQPARLLRNTYLAAGEEMRSGKTLLAAVLINDFDTAVGEWAGPVQYTVNRQNLFGELMHVADYPETVEGISTPRIPIVVTGNNFARLYLPLTRPGRMQLFEWIPTPEEKIQIIGGIFPELSLTDVQALVQQFPDPPISFFAALKTALIDEQLSSLLDRYGLRNILSTLSSARRVSGLRDFRDYNLKDLVALGRRSAEEVVLTDHLVSHEPDAKPRRKE